MLEKNSEEIELRQRILSQTNLPTSLLAFKNHPVYALEKDLRWNEFPVTELTSCSNIKQSFLIFKGERVFLRQDIETLYTRRDWRKQMRSVIKDQTDYPTKVIKRKLHRKFKKLDFNEEPSWVNANRKDDNIEYVEIKLYRFNQTEPFEVPSVLNDIIPVNEYGNVEIWDNDIRFVPKGAVFILGKEAIKAAEQLMLPYAPAITGFENRCNKKIPIIGGIIVLHRHKRIMINAVENVQDYKEEKAMKNRKIRVLHRWKRIVMRLLTRSRIHETYG